MGIRSINNELCNGCGICADTCPMDVLRMDEKRGRPFVKYLRDCQSCFLCSRDCPTQAITVTSVRERRIPAS